MPYILDTDHVSLLLQGHEVIARRLAAHPPAEIWVTLVTAQELLDGCPCSSGGSRRSVMFGPMRA